MCPQPNSSGTDSSVRAIRPRARRYPFKANAELIELESEKLFHQQTCDLSLFGCRVTPESLPVGTRVRIRIVYRGASFQALGRVACTHKPSGIGIQFIGVQAADQQLLEKWVGELRTQSG